MGMEQNEPNERVNNAVETGDRNTASELFSKEANSQISERDGSKHKSNEDNVKELDFNSGKAVEKLDATPKQIADNINKNGGFGKGDERFDTEMTLSKAMKDGNVNKVVADINKELADAGSPYRLHGDVKGGASGSADQIVKGVRTSTRETTSNGEFSVKDADGKPSDTMSLSRGSSERIENGKVVGGRTWSQGESGGSAGAWGKTPAPGRDSSARSPYQLNNFGIDGYDVPANNTAFGSKHGSSSMNQQIERRKK